jgi:hypothetical protein
MSRRNAGHAYMRINLLKMFREEIAGDLIKVYVRSVGCEDGIGIRVS